MTRGCDCHLGVPQNLQPLGKGRQRVTADVNPRWIEWAFSDRPRARVEIEDTKNCLNYGEGVTPFGHSLQDT